MILSWEIRAGFPKWSKNSLREQEKGDWLGFYCDQRVELGWGWPCICWGLHELNFLPTPRLVSLPRCGVKGDVTVGGGEVRSGAWKLSAINHQKWSQILSPLVGDFVRTGLKLVANNFCLKKKSIIWTSKVNILCGPQRWREPCGWGWRLSSGSHWCLTSRHWA